MVTLGTALVVASLAAGAGSLSLVAYLLRYRSNAGAWWFVVALTAQSVFCFGYTAGLLVADPLLHRWLEIGALVGLTWVGVPFLGFALAYTGRTKLLRSWAFRGLFVFPLTATVLLPSNGVHRLLWTAFDVTEVAGLAVGTYTFQPLFFVVFFGSTLVSGIGALLLFDTVWSYGPLYRREAFAVAVSPVPPAAGVFVWLFELGPLAGFNWVVVLFLPHVLFDTYAFVGSGMFDFHPATSRAAERSALDDLPQPVFVLDESGRIVEINRAAAEIFDLDERDVITRQVSAVVDADVGPETSEQRISVETRERRYEFRVDASQLTDSGDNHVGSLLFFQDVTTEIQREERLAVLNRVLRHNLRNELSVAQGSIEVARDSVGTERGQDSLDRANTALTELLETSEQARTIEQTLGKTSQDRRTIALDDLLAAECAEANTDDSATISVSCPSLSVYTEPAVLGTIVGELVGNAIEHHDGDSPEIHVTVEYDDELEITIQDDGPGIPEHERAALESGDETALDHGSGLGLWLIKWGASRLGGDVSFDVREEGTRVTLTFPPAMVVERGADRSSVTTTMPEQSVRADGVGDHRQ